MIKMQRIKMWERRMSEIERLNGWVNEWKRKKIAWEAEVGNARVGRARFLEEKTFLTFVCVTSPCEIANPKLRKFEARRPQNLDEKTPTPRVAFGLN